MNDDPSGEDESDLQNAEFFDFPTFAPTLSETQGWKCLENSTIEAFEINHDGTILRFTMDDGYKIVAFARGDARVSKLSVAKLKREFRRGLFVREVYSGWSEREGVIDISIYGHRDVQHPRKGYGVRAATTIRAIILGMEEDVKDFDWICIDTMFADPK